MRLFIVRHGETIENAARIVTGQQGGLLSPKGIEQAGAIAVRLRGQPISRIYSSDLARAFETAAILSDALGAETRVDTRLREQHFGEYEGRPLKALLRQMKKTGEDFFGLNPPGGERAEIFRDRVHCFFREIKKMHERDSVIVVTHHGVITVLLASLMNKTPEFRSKDLLRHGMILLAEVDAGNAVSLKYSVPAKGHHRWDTVWEETKG